MMNEFYQLFFTILHHIKKAITTALGKYHDYINLQPISGNQFVIYQDIIDESQMARSGIQHKAQLSGQVHTLSKQYPESLGLMLRLAIFQSSKTFPARSYPILKDQM